MPNPEIEFLRDENAKLMAECKKKDFKLADAQQTITKLELALEKMEKRMQDYENASNPNGVPENVVERLKQHKNPTQPHDFTPEELDTIAVLKIRDILWKDKQAKKLLDRMMSAKLALGES